MSSKKRTYGKPIIVHNWAEFTVCHVRGPVQIMFCVLKGKV